MHNYIFAKEAERKEEERETNAYTIIQKAHPNRVSIFFSINVGRVKQRLHIQFGFLFGPNVLPFFSRRSEAESPVNIVPTGSWEGVI